MEESALDVREVYRSTRENRDYNVIRNPHAGKPTSKKHYLAQELRLNCSPGPANSANHQDAWAKKPLLQPKRAPKTTYLDDITRHHQKLNFPAPTHYTLAPAWPARDNHPNCPTEKTNFVDTCQYEADKTPGPGSYNLRTHLTSGPLDKKWTPHSPIKPRETLAAEVGTYNPCPQDYNTFARYQLKKAASHPTLPKVLEKTPRAAKENGSPGPGTYSTVNCWAGKQALKKGEFSYLSHISKGPSPNVYH